MSMRHTLLNNAGTPGVPVIVHPGGYYSFMGKATWPPGSAAKLQILLPDGATFGDIVGAELSADGMLPAPIFFPAGASVKVVDNGTQPTAGTFWLVSA